MLEHLDDSTRGIDLRGVGVAASAYAVVGAVTRVHHEALGAFPLGLALMVYVLAAGRFARRSEWGWMWGTARDSFLSITAGLTWIAVEAAAAGPIRPEAPPPPPEWAAFDTGSVALPPKTGGMDFSIAEGDCFGPDPVEAAAFNAAAVLAVGMGAVLIGGIARWLSRLQQETVDG